MYMPIWCETVKPERMIKYYIFTLSYHIIQFLNDTVWFKLWWWRNKAFYIYTKMIQYGGQKKLIKVLRICDCKWSLANI